MAPQVLSKFQKPGQCDAAPIVASDLGYRRQRTSDTQISVQISKPQGVPFDYKLSSWATTFLILYINLNNNNYYHQAPPNMSTPAPSSNGQATTSSKVNATIRNIATFKTTELGLQLNFRKAIWNMIRNGNMDTENETAWMTDEAVHLVTWTALVDPEYLSRKGTTSIYYTGKDGKSQIMEFKDMVLDELLVHLNECVHKLGVFTYKTVDAAEAQEMVTEAQSA